MDKYTFLEKIGRGTHGTVYLLQTTTHDFVVCKTITDKNTKYAHREINILSKLAHKRIIKLIETIKVDKTNYLILEHANHGSLENIIAYNKKENFCNVKLVYSCISQIIDGLNYLHSKKIIHRDIKPSNILINQFFVGKEECIEFKICDFSLSTVVNNNTGNIVGTPFYMAPEIIKKECYTENVDVWSLGVCMYEMIFLKRPFTGKSRKELQANILNEEISIVHDDEFLCGVMKKCLEKDPYMRSGSYELRRLDRIKYFLAIGELKQRDRRIFMLEKKIKELEIGINYYPTPEDLSKKSIS